MKFVKYPNKARNAIFIKDSEYPFFIRKGNIICDTLTHEYQCAVTDEVMRILRKNNR